MDTLHCPECESENVSVLHEEGDDTGDQAEMECEDCGNIEVVTRADVTQFFC